MSPFLQVIKSIYKNCHPNQVNKSNNENSTIDRSENLTEAKGIFFLRSANTVRKHKNKFSTSRKNAHWENSLVRMRSGPDTIAIE